MVKERAPISQSFKVQKEMSSKVPAMPPNPTVTSYSWVIYPKKPCGFTRPSLGGLSGALHPNLPQILCHRWLTGRALSSFGELFLSLRDEAGIPLLNFVMGTGKEDIRTLRRGMGRERQPSYTPGLKNPGLGHTVLGGGGPLT